MQVYVLVKDNEHINKLGEQGWGLLVDDPAIMAQGFPIVVKKDFRLPRNAKILDDVAVRWLNAMANKSTENVVALKKYGFFFTKVYSDEEAKKVYKVEKKGPAILNWRVEVNYNEEPAMLYITFGHFTLQSPAMANKEVVDLYVPKGVIERALKSGSIKVVDIPEEEAQTTLDENA